MDEEPVLTRVPFTLAWLLAAAPPVNPLPVGADHEKVVPVGKLGGTTEKALPLQIVADP